MSDSSTSTTSKYSFTPIEEGNVDTNAQFPSPNRVLAYTPAELCTNLMTPNAPQTATNTVACQTLLTLPTVIPEILQKILNLYVFSENTHEEVQSQEPTYGSADFENLLRHAQTYFYGLPSPPISDMSSSDQPDDNGNDEEMSDTSTSTSSDDGS